MNIGMLLPKNAAYARAQIIGMLLPKNVLVVQAQIVFGSTTNV
jgi:hypothetical protein